MRIDISRRKEGNVKRLLLAIYYVGMASAVGLSLTVGIILAMFLVNFLIEKIR